MNYYVPDFGILEDIDCMDECEKANYREELEVVVNNYYKDDGKQLIEDILKNDRAHLNNIVRDNKFPAWDIAKKIQKNNYQMTAKQKTALENVYAFYIFI